MQIGEIIESKYQRELNEKDYLLLALGDIIYSLRQQFADEDCELYCDGCPAVEYDCCPLFLYNDSCEDKEMPKDRRGTAEFCNHYVIKALRCHKEYEC